MKVRTALPVALSLVVAAGALAPAMAAPPKPKPITEEYEMEHIPMPFPLTGSEGFGETSCMIPELEGISTTTKTIKTKGPGTLTVDVTKFDGDWDITVMNDKGDVLGSGAGTTTPTALTTTGNVEKLVVKTKKAMTLQIAVCNFLGGPTAHGKYVFEYK